jgi:hypothetical protein
VVTLGLLELPTAIPTPDHGGTVDDEGEADGPTIDVHP